MVDDQPSRSTTPNWGPIAGLVGGLFVVFFVISALAWMFSFKGTDSGEVCVIREGGPFDGRAIKDVRQPSEAPKPIGAWNHQDCLPTTERDSNDVIQGEPTYPTKDSVQVIADGQVLFRLTTDENKIKDFFRKYGRRKWDGHDLTDDAGWLAFLRTRFQPIQIESEREVVGSYDCVALNNLCQYVQSKEALTKGDVKKVENTQNLNAAADSIEKALRTKLKAAFGDDYFEDVRYQNLRIRFTGGVQRRIDEAQSLRTQAANAELEAARKVAEAKGEADKKVAQARGARAAAFQQQKAYKANPTQAQIDKIEAFCGPNGCDPQVLGGNLNDVISSIAGRRR